MKNNLIQILVACLFLLLVSGRSFSQTGKSNGTLIGNEKKIEMWKDARFGMFIHWGPVTLKGTEIGWSRGKEVPIELPRAARETPFDFRLSTFALLFIRP